MNFDARIPAPVNEPVLSYAPGSPERQTLEEALRRMSGQTLEVPMFIGGQEVRTGETAPMVMPHRHAHVLGSFHMGGVEHVHQAIDAALKAKADWARMPFQSRAAIFLRAAELLATRHRATLNAATMMGQSKTAHQAEIDAACELIDFLRFNVKFAEQIHSDQPLYADKAWNAVDYRPLDGFVLAVSPFNFTAIAGNLPAAPAIMGNTVVWKPSLAAMYSAWHVLELLREAGLPDGVINLVTGDPAATTQAAIDHPDFGGLHFTGSTAVMRSLMKRIGDNIDTYKQYPRVIGETGGKDFVFVHESAIDDVDAVATAIVRGGFEFQGQKCSAASRIFVPTSVWKKLESPVLDLIGQIKMGDVADFSNFMGAVIHQQAFDRIRGYQEYAAASAGAKILAGGKAHGEEGYFIEPTLVKVDDPRDKLMTEEIFGPVVSLHVYDDDKYAETLKVCDEAAEYALTGAIFARDRAAIDQASWVLRHAAGNFYVNDKPTGAVVGQQPFGGSRASGTNDKAGSILNMIRWTSPRTIKENLTPPRSPWYPYQG